MKQRYGTGQQAARRLGASSLVASVLMLLPQVALACPVCGQAKEAQNTAYIVSTGLMSFLPLLFIAGVVYWLVRRARTAEAPNETCIDVMPRAEGIVDAPTSAVGLSQAPRADAGL